MGDGSIPFNKEALNKEYGKVYEQERQESLERIRREKMTVKDVNKEAPDKKAERITDKTVPTLENKGASK